MSGVPLDQTYCFLQIVISLQVSDDLLVSDPFHGDIFLCKTARQQSLNLVQKASTLGIKLVAGTEVACETEQDAERAFDDLVERFLEGLPALLAKAEAVIAARGLSPIAADALRGLVCSLPSFKPNVFDPESVSAFADPLRRSLESLAVELREPGVSDDEGLAAVERFFNAGLARSRPSS